MASRRRGVTLVGLIVVILVIGVLMGLAVPAIQRGRAESRRMQCSKNLFNTGLALQGYFITKGNYPNAGTFREPSNPYSSGTPIPSTITGSFAEATGSTFWRPDFVGGAGQGRDAGPLRNWVVDVAPYLDYAGLSNAWNRDAWYGSNSTNAAFYWKNNHDVGNNSISALSCPSDPTVRPHRGNLSYVVNGGFSRWWYAPTIGWTGQAKGGVDNATGVDWGADVAGRTGVMFLGSDTGTMPWDRRTGINDIPDGTSQTILATENLNAGYSKGSPRTAGLETNWACPHPNFVMFIASDKICPRGQCPTGKATPSLTTSTAGEDGDAWRNANNPRAFPYESINYGTGLPAEGEYPFPSSHHKGGVNIAMCDGSVRFLSDTIDGIVYAKLITPAGSRLPPALQQLPLAEGSY